MKQTENKCKLCLTDYFNELCTDPEEDGKLEWQSGGCASYISLSTKTIHTAYGSCYDGDIYQIKTNVMNKLPKTDTEINKNIILPVCDKCISEMITRNEIKLIQTDDYFGDSNFQAYITDEY